jgi:hypothetical protein
LFGAASFSPEYFGKPWLRKVSCLNDAVAGTRHCVTGRFSGNRCCLSTFRPKLQLFRFVFLSTRRGNAESNRIFLGPARGIVTAAWAEDRATLASDPSAVPGAKMRSGVSVAATPASSLHGADSHESDKRKWERWTGKRGKLRICFMPPPFGLRAGVSRRKDRRGRHRATRRTATRRACAPRR